MGANSKNNDYRLIILKQVSECIWNHLEMVGRVNYYLLHNDEVEDIECILEYLENFFETIEVYIDKHLNEVSVTFDFENEVRDFAREIFAILWKFMDDLYEYEKFRNLLLQRHMAYNVYHSLNKNSIDIEKFDKQMLAQIYIGLASFYEYFYGQFKDNEEAIELLCKYYPEVLPKSLTEEKLAEILYPHISNAGTPGALGYSYQGIRIIKQYIGRLSKGVIYHLLMQYRLSDIAYKDIYRHQIVTIIRYSCLDRIEKLNLKFQYLDFIVIVAWTNQMLEKTLREKLGIVYLGFHEKFVNNILVLNEKPSVYWKRESTGKNRLIIENRTYMEVSLKENADNGQDIRIKKIGSKKEINLSFLEDSWSLDYLLSKDASEILRELGECDENVMEYKQMFFSLVYLNRYRSLKL